MEKTTITYKCPGCSGELVWNGEIEKFICSWCSSDYPEQEITGAPSEITEEKKHRMEMESKFADDTDVYICSSCGAEIICDHNTAASFCYYCHNPVTLGARLSGNYRPEMIIPFQLSKREAEAAFKAQCMKKRFLPSGFTSDLTLEKMTGLYVPYWLCDCTVNSFMRAGGSQDITKAYGDTRSTTKVTYALEREAKMTYMGIPADGSLKIEDTMIDAIDPYDYRFMREFDMSYLAGYYCDKFDVQRKDVLPRIKERVEEEAPEVLLRDLAQYDDLIVTEKHNRILGTKWHYAMLPVWFMTYKHHGKIYSFAMNGQTGKFSGEFPISLSKLFAAAVGIAAVVTLISNICINKYLAPFDLNNIRSVLALICGLATGAAFFFGVNHSYSTYEKPATNNFLDVRTIDIYSREDKIVRSTTREYSMNDLKHSEGGGFNKRLF